MTANVVGVLLAGGQSRRMGGGDKGFRLLGGIPILDRVIERFRPQIGRLVINANGDPARFSSVGLPVVADSLADFPGPLAGVLAGFDWAAANAPQALWIATVATDAPFIPRNLVSRMVIATEEGADLVCASSHGRSHPVIGLWATRLRDDLRRALVEENIRKVDIWTARHRLAVVDFPVDPIDPFFNVNAPEDLAAAERLVSGG